MDNQLPKEEVTIDTSSVSTKEMNHFLTKMYGFMTIAVLVSAFMAFIGPFTYLLPLFEFFEAHSTLTLILFFVIPLALVIGINAAPTTKPGVSMSLLMLLSIVYGVELSSIVVVIAQDTLALAFVCSSVVFITMAVIGTVTKKDLSNLGSYAYAALIGLIVATIVNMFVKSSTFDYIMSYVGVIIFTILTAWDAQSAKELYAKAMIEDAGSMKTEDDKTKLASNIAIRGALELYLDFLNIFLYLVRIFAKSDN